MGLPLVGYFPWLDHNDPTTSFAALQQKYGSVFSFYLAYKPIVVACGWEAVREVFISDNLIGRPPVCFSSDRFGGKNYGVYKKIFLHVYES